MYFKAIVSYTIFILIYLTTQVWAHGLGYTITQGNNIPILQITFTGGEAAGFASVKIFHKNNLIQTGKTTAQGKFPLLIPKEIKNIKIEVYAGMGHKLIFFYTPIQKNQAKDISHNYKKNNIIYSSNIKINWLKVILGLSLILNLIFLGKLRCFRQQ
ncbi:hypothetical protein SAMN04488516_101344 [Desulfonauticus submarinus]|uniref:Nickel transport protein n=1 Tax=Desulfonauticus submarinus TaxID=206665 RepID=A0A1H0AAJ6_9BACT|nr:hypothetical protein [Desulfonauticus submarinus]SDN30638.1 hypothetical protein SAMN04488516_101344 [Desulfonauticus submarinus]